MNRRIFESNWLSISSQCDSYILQYFGIPDQILVPPVTRLFRSKWLHFFFQCSSAVSYIWFRSKTSAQPSEFVQLSPNKERLRNLCNVNYLLRENIAWYASSYLTCFFCFFVAIVFNNTFRNYTTNANIQVQYY